MARRENDLFIGTEYLNLEGRTIKHPSLINEYGSINVNKISNTPLHFVGMDLETDVNTGNLMLLGFYIEKQFLQYTDNFLNRLLQIVRWAERKKMNITYWNRLDPFQLFKLFLLEKNEFEQKESMRRFGKTGGVWDKTEGKWSDDAPPVIQLFINGYEFGIQTVIRSSIKFYYIPKNSKTLRTIWAFDIAQLYQNGIEYEALGRYDEKTNSYPNARLPYYSKVDESAHIVDWDRYWDDRDYYDLVNHSNQLDARAVHDLADLFQKDFYTAFGYYPTTLISAGSIARASIVATILKKHNALLPNKKLGIPKTHEYLLAYNDINSIPLINYFDFWLEKYGGNVVKNIFSITTEAYKGGYIEALEFGFSKEAYYADISGAYPSFIQKLYDLRNSKVTHGTGEPPSIEYSYCFIRGDVYVPEDVDIHPLTIKHPINKDTNIRATGHYRASYLKEERDYLLTLGATFENEEWYNIETEGRLSPLATVSTELSNLRTHFLSIGDSAEYIAKASNNSIYGVMFEAINSHYELINNYDIRDIEYMIYGVLDVIGLQSYDIRLDRESVDVIVSEVLIMLENGDLKSDIISYISTFIFENSYLKPYDNNITSTLPLMQQYIRKVNLQPIKNDLKHHFDKEYLKHYMRFNNDNGIYYDTFLEEIREFGLIYDGSDVDQIISFLIDYDKLKAEPSKRQLSPIIDYITNDDYNSIIERIFEYVNEHIDYITRSSIESSGYRAGEFFNPLYASWVTSQTRILLSKAANNIKSNGGVPKLLMTDAIFWKGDAANLDKSFYTEVKTTGFFEPPTLVNNLLSLGSGRYEYYEKGRYINKKRGLNTTDWHDPEGLDRTYKFSWYEAITNPKYLTDDGKIRVNVRTLISVGMVVNSRQRIEDGQIVGYSVHDLGKIIDQVREVDALIGFTKRFIPNDINAFELGNKVVKTKPLKMSKFMFGTEMIIDQTLPKLRKLMMEITPETSRERRRRVSRKTSKTYHEKNKDQIYENYRNKYGIIRGLGYTRDEARLMANWSYDRLKELNITT